MKNTSKILALVLVVMTLLMSLSAITASAATETVTMVFEATELGLQAQGTYADGETLTAGTEKFFTLVMSAKVKVDSSDKTFEDGYSSNTRVNWGGKSTTSLNLIKFTVPSAATIKVWWVCGGDGRTVALWDADGNSIGSSAVAAPAKNALYIDTYTASTAGTYAIAGPEGSNYIFKVEVSWEAELCEHNFEGGVCTLCGTPDPNACKHTNTTPATCTDPEVCVDCGVQIKDALGHTEGAAPTCTAAQTCTVCGKELVAALGHTLTFVNTLPTAEAAGKTVADCSVCNEHLDFGEVKAMTGGTYVLDAAALEGIAQYSLFDGHVKVVDEVFACHLSYKYRTDANAKTFAADDWTSTHRMNFGGTSDYCNNGEGDAAVRNGGLKNYVQIVTTGTTTLSFHWGVGDANREIGVYDAVTGELVAHTEFAGAKNDLAYSTLEVPAGAYLIGTYIGEGVSSGGNYFYKITVDVEVPHTHKFADATCTEPSKCECGETQVDALGHSFAFGECTRCGASDPDYVAPQPPVEEPPVEEPQNLFQRIIAWIMDLINQILAMFKK